MKLRLERPIVFFDLETTGTNVTRDRIIELSYIKVFPDGREEEESMLINPGMPIPPESTAVHHITDDDVADKPRFEEITERLREVFANSDIAGFNSNKFDVPMLIEELSRAGKRFDVFNRNFIDVQNIFHKMEPRTLVAAYKFYCNADLENAHSAASDTRATYEVFKQQLERYEQLPDSVKGLNDFSRTKGSIDLSARVVRNDNGEPVFNFGKHKGKPVREVFRMEPSFYHWIMQGDFPKDTKDVLTTFYYEIYQAKTPSNKKNS